MELYAKFTQDKESFVNEWMDNLLIERHHWGSDYHVFYHRVERVGIVLDNECYIPNYFDSERLQEQAKIRKILYKKISDKESFSPTPSKDLGMSEKDCQFICCALFQSIQRQQAKGDMIRILHILRE